MSEDTENDLDKYTPPVERLDEKIYGRARTLIPLSDLLLPGSGTALDFIADLIGTPYERRLQQWAENIAAAVKDLLQNRGITVDDLRSNDEFVSVFIQASQAAVRTHQREKIGALRNAVINAADGINISADLKQLFIRYVDELTPSHIALLTFVNENEARLAQTQSYEILFQEFNVQSPERGVERDEFKLLCADLIGRALLRISSSVDDFTDIHNANYMVGEQTENSPRLRVTDIGRQFLVFIRGKERFQ